MKVSFPYGREKIEYDFDDNQLCGVLESHINEYVPELSQEELVLSAMENPVGSECLYVLAKDKKNIVIIASDHTRPVPSKVIIPPILSEIRSVNKEAKITILIATGCHRGTTKDELIYKFGEDIVNSVDIHIHDCLDEKMLVNIGTLPSGSACEINKIAYEADLLISEGFIEPHLFAGFSGGRKSVLPGVAGKSTVLANHCSEFIDSSFSRTGNLVNNPIHNDMVWAARKAKLSFIVNVVLNEDKKVIYAVAGDVEAAHKKGTDFLSGLCGVKAEQCDVAITTNGGYPLDQNVYQSIKGMTAAESALKNGGVIIMLSQSADGIGGDDLYHQLADEVDINKTMADFLRRGRSETLPDQWMTQILLRILLKNKVIYISDMDDDLVRKMHMIPASSIEEAINTAKKLLNKENIKIVAIPDGISVMVV